MVRPSIETSQTKNGVELKGGGEIVPETLNDPIKKKVIQETLKHVGFEKGTSYFLYQEGTTVRINFIKISGSNISQPGLDISLIQGTDYREKPFQITEGGILKLKKFLNETPRIIIPKAEIIRTTQHTLASLQDEIGNRSA